LKPPDAFLIVPIRSTGVGLCNNDFCRGSHCDVVCVSIVVPGNAGPIPRAIPFPAEPDTAHQSGADLLETRSALGIRIRRKFTGSYRFCSNFQHRIRELELPVLLILGKKDGGSRWYWQSASGRNP
jgi:hypothetical protein